MNRRALILAAVFAASARGALASSKPKAEEKEPAAGQYVELQPVALPITAYGEVVNYVFVYVRLNLAASVDAAKMRAREPYFRDALVRAGNRAPFNSPKGYLSLDETKLKAAMMREGAAIAGAGAIKSVEVLSQSPKRRTGFPKPRAG